MSDNKKTSQLAIQYAMKAWSQKETSHIEVDTRIAQEFAITVDEILSKPWLGNATTKELIEELQARADVGGYANYKTSES